MDIINLSGNDNNQVDLIVSPFRLLVAGKSGSGKSNMVMNLILRHLDYDFIYIYAKHLDDKMYVKLKEHFDKINQRVAKKFKLPDYTCYLMSDDYDSMVTLSPKRESLRANSDEFAVTNNELDKSKKNLIVIDDFMMEKNKTNIQDLMVSSRHKNASIIYITQSYHKTDKIVRENCNYLALFRVASKKEIIELAKSVATDMEYKDFYELFTKITNKKYGFMIIDTTENDFPYLRYRDGWDGLIINNNQE